MNSMTVKRYKTKMDSFIWVFLTAILIVTLILAGEHAYAQTIKLTLVSGWTSPSQGNVKLEEFVKRVNEKGKGKVFIDYKGGAEIAPMTQSPGLVRDGVFDMAHTTPGYYGGLCPEAVLMYYAPSDPSLLRKIGFFNILDEVHRKRMGCTNLGTLWRGEKFTILSKKPITSADFSGWKMHSLPIYTIGLKYLGASTVALSVPEFYTALERGVVDAVPLPMGTVSLDLKLYEVSKYILHPPMPITSSGTLLANAKRWDGLPSDVKKLITDILTTMEPEVYDYYSKVGYSGEVQLVEKGMKIAELPPAESKKYNYAFSDYTWEKSCERLPEYGKKMYEICKPHLTR
jgi:TRAP-type C4-dicarboxylate transport system substrate-binding protein